MATIAAADLVTQRGGSVAHSRPPIEKIAILDDAALPSPISAAFHQHGGAPQANRRTSCPKMFKAADASRIPARHLGDNFLNAANFNNYRNKPSASSFNYFLFQSAPIT